MTEYTIYCSRGELMNITTIEENPVSVDNSNFLTPAVSKARRAYRLPLGIIADLFLLLSSIGIFYLSAVVGIILFISATVLTSAHCISATKAKKTTNFYGINPKSLYIISCGLCLTCSVISVLTCLSDKVDIYFSRFSDYLMGVNKYFPSFDSNFRGLLIFCLILFLSTTLNFIVSSLLNRCCRKNFPFTKAFMLVGILQFVIALIPVAIITYKVMCSINTLFPFNITSLNLYIELSAWASIFIFVILNFINYIIIFCGMRKVKNAVFKQTKI